MDVPLADLRDAAFGTSPHLGVRAATSSRDPVRRWLAAVVLGGQGWYAAAAAVLDELRRDPCSPPLVASLAASALASHRRQLGAHSAARRLDAHALRLAAVASVRPWSPDPDGVDPDGAHADAVVGLAADAIGAGDVRSARRVLHTLGDDMTRIGDTRSWRTAVRAGWVRAELAIAEGDAAAATIHAAAALATARRRGAARHVVKSRVVLAVARHLTGVVVTRELHDVTAELAAMDLWSLRWPAERVLAEVTGSRRHSDNAIAALDVTLCRTDPALRTAAMSSRWVPSGAPHTGDSAERSSTGEIRGEICTGLCQGSTPRDR